MATIKGLWVLNKIISRPSLDKPDIRISFTSNGEECCMMSINVGGLYYYLISGNDYHVYYNDDIWIDEAYRTVDFGTTEQEVADEFYEWFTANASQEHSGGVYRVKASTLYAISEKLREITGSETKYTPIEIPDGIDAAVKASYTRAEEVAF